MKDTFDVPDSPKRGTKGSADFNIMNINKGSQSYRKSQGIVKKNIHSELTFKKVRSDINLS